MTYSKEAPKKDRDLIARCRAARGYIESTNSEADALAAFMDIFHPKFPEDKTRAMLSDAREHSRRRTRAV